MSNSAGDNKAMMLLSLLLVNIRILSRFSILFIVMLSSFLIIPVVKEKIKLKLVLVFPTGAPTMLVKEVIDTPPIIARKTKLSLCNQRLQHICLVF